MLPERSGHSLRELIVLFCFIPNRYPNSQICWAQEEHKNMGAWNYVQPRFNNLLNRDIKYAGRPTAASPATGSKHQHLKEFARMMDEAFA